MKTNLTIQTRCFTVRIRDERTGREQEDKIVLELNQIKAAEALGLDCDEAIRHRYSAQGFKVLGISKARRNTITVNLEELHRAYCIHETGRRQRHDHEA